MPSAETPKPYKPSVAQVQTLVTNQLGSSNPVTEGDLLILSSDVLRLSSGQQKRSRFNAGVKKAKKTGRAILHIYQSFTSPQEAQNRFKGMITKIRQLQSSAVLNTTSGQKDDEVIALSGEGISDTVTVKGQSIIVPSIQDGLERSLLTELEFTASADNVKSAPSESSTAETASTKSTKRSWSW
jgi:hypothetical protein